MSTLAKKTAGRGKFDHHPNYLAYKEVIVDDPKYRDMPGARSADGSVVWQVSSGKTTSFYEFYRARFDWWVKKADKMKVPGKLDSNDRFTITARLIHPTGFRPCLICGKEKNVGYYYLNDRFSYRLKKETHAATFHKGQPIDDAIEGLTSRIGKGPTEQILLSLFPERSRFFRKWGVTPEAFHRSNYLESVWLSPGFMGDPPHRLDGLHDYCLDCRSARDPGRSDENMRTYIHDRRAFEWWAEGDWNVADVLYNSAGEGKCCRCGKPLVRVSPDHVGPLACGFKHTPQFQPMCPAHQSAKNRRMDLEDVGLLLEMEEKSGESLACWQVRGLWDASKKLVKTKSDAEELSSAMRSLQDFYFRSLSALRGAGRSRFLATLLHPEYAFFNVTFEGLDRGTLRFAGIHKTPVQSSFKKSLARRTIRIAFDSLDDYVKKREAARRLRPRFDTLNPNTIEDILKATNKLKVTAEDREWDRVMQSALSSAEKERQIGNLFEKRVTRNPDDIAIFDLMEHEFRRVGEEASPPWTKS